MAIFFLLAVALVGRACVPVKLERAWHMLTPRNASKRDKTRYGVFNRPSESTQPSPLPPALGTKCFRALVVEPGNSRALARRAQAHEELGYFRLAVEDLEAAEASVSASVRDGHRRGDGSEALAGELAEVVKRLEHARWTKVGPERSA